MTLPQPQTNQEAILTALAVLGAADQETLEQLLEQRLDQQDIASLVVHSGISAQGRVLLMAPEMAAARLKALEANDFLHFRILHQWAASILARRLSAGDAEVEFTFMAVFSRLAEHLRHQDLAKLPALIEALGQVPLKSRQHQHYRTLMEAMSLWQSGRYDATLKLCNMLLNHPDLDLALRGRTHNLRATSFYHLGRLQQALDDYRAALTILQQTGNQLSAGIILQNMGALAYDLQDYDEAEQRLRQAAEIFALEGSGEWMAAVQNELGLVYRDQGKWADALRCFEHFIAKSNEHAAYDDVAIGLLNLGEVLFFQGRLQASETTLQAALQTMLTDAFRVDVLLTLGMIHQIEGNLDDAQHYYQETLSLTTQLGRRFMLAAVHYRLANLCQQQFDVEGVWRHLLAGIDVVEETRAPLREEGLKISLLGRWQQLYEAMVLHLVGQQRVGEAFHYVERARSRTFLDMLADAPATDSPIDGGVTEEPLTLSALQTILPQDAALVEFFATGLPGAPASMLANIPPEANSIREYLLAPERLLAFIVTKEAVHVVELNANVRQIEGQHFHRADGRLRGVQPLPGQPLRGLHRWPDLAARLLLPLQPYVAGKHHLFFVPHGVLHYLPLHALLDVKELTGIAHTTVSYGPSASILFKRATTPLTTRPEGAGLDRGALNSLAIGVNGADLHHAEAEAAWLAQRLKGEALLGSEATCSAVRQALPNYAVIHFSCHGHFRRRDPLQSALALSDGELSAIDLLLIGRLSAELVTLSACDTGLNQLHPGDELMGLTRAFLGCGVRSLLVTLWPVYEIPTRILIDHFYNAWREGASKASALSGAQHYLMQMDSIVFEKHLLEYGHAQSMVTQTLSQFQSMLPGPFPFAHPYYWGAFLLIGHPSDHKVAMYHGYRSGEQRQRDPLRGDRLLGLVTPQGVSPG